MPAAPRPARILPQMDSRSNVRTSGPEGVGRSFLFHHTKRGALGSPKTRSSAIPASTCKYALDRFTIANAIFLFHHAKREACKSPNTTSSALPPFTCRNRLALCIRYNSWCHCMAAFQQK